MDPGKTARRGGPASISPPLPPPAVVPLLRISPLGRLAFGRLLVGDGAVPRRGEPPRHLRGLPRVFHPRHPRDTAAGQPPLEAPALPPGAAVSRERRNPVEGL